MKKVNDLENLSKKYRREIFEKLLKIKQGHPGSIFSMMDIVVALYHGGYVRFDSKNKTFLDKVLISKGHATAALYPILRDFGVLPLKEWDDWGNKASLLRVFGNISIPGIDITSGSLGHCIGAGAGMALSYKRSGKNKNVFVTPASKQDSSMLAVFNESNCLIQRPVYAPKIKKGSVVPILKFPYSF